MLWVSLAFRCISVQVAMSSLVVSPRNKRFNVLGIGYSIGYSMTRGRPYLVPKCTIPNVIPFEIRGHKSMHQKANDVAVKINNSVWDAPMMVRPPVEIFPLQHFHDKLRDLSVTAIAGCFGIHVSHLLFFFRGGPGGPPSMPRSGVCRSRDLPEACRRC